MPWAILRISLAEVSDNARPEAMRGGLFLNSIARVSAGDFPA